ncbi:MAG TPA: hypothetical protein VFQ72_00685 [Candidatus Paceibacterota bacterium]|nr:hypothetical protein [Candidatus Paceibacterota bacterium]
MRGQAKYRQSKLRARRRRRAFYLCLYAVTAAGLLLSALSYISGLGALAIQEVHVTGASPLSSESIAAVARQDLAGNYISLFSRGNFLLYPRSAIRRDVLALPPIQSAKVYRDGVRTLAISVVERQPAAAWCADDKGDRTGCYSADENGLVFAPHDPSADELVYSGGTVGEQPLGSHILPPERFRRIRFFMTELAGLSVEPRRALLEASSTYMAVSLADGGRVFIDTADDLSTVLGNIAAVISDRTVAPSLADFLRDLDYMKLDIGNKVVYKLKDAKIRP